jgi:hypothetical protein
MSKEEKAAKRREEELEKAQEKNTIPKDEMENGPVPNRTCTDILCCLLFVAFLVSVIGLSGYSIMKGDPMRLLTAFDDNGRPCGLKGDGSVTADYPLLYFPGISTADAASAAATGTGPSASPLRYPLCVKSCPTKDGPVECAPINIMTAAPNWGAKTGSWYWKDCRLKDPATNHATFIKYDTSPLVGKFCVPNASAGKDLFAVFKVAF